MKTLYLIGGTMGIGKTTVSRLLKEQLDRSVMLDGDWCWDMHPFTVTAETKAMVMDNICHLLNGFLHCSELENVIFCWVMHEQSILDDILSRVDTDGVRVCPVSLICNEATLTARLRSDVDAGIRQADVIERSVKRLPLYAGLRTVKVDVSTLTAEETAEAILRATEHP